MLGKHDIRETVATVVTDVRGNSKVVVYIVPDILPSPSSAEIQNYLSERIPFYMIPSKVLTLESIPLTATEKVDRRALPEPSFEEPTLGEYEGEPLNLMEQKMQISGQKY